MHNPAPNIYKFCDSPLKGDTHKLIHQGAASVHPSTIIAHQISTWNHPNPQLSKQTTLIWPMQKFIIKMETSSPKIRILSNKPMEFLQISMEYFCVPKFIWVPLRAQKIKGEKNRRKEYLCVRRKTRARRRSAMEDIGERRKAFQPCCQNDGYALTSVQSKSGGVDKDFDDQWGGVGSRFV